MKKLPSLIVLLTDFGYQDEYVAMMKAVILNINYNARFIDLCHNIPAQNIHWAAILLGKCYYYFPKGTIFVSVVDPGVGSKRKIVLLKTRKYYFIAPDNGLLTMIMEKEKYKVRDITNSKYTLKEISNTFHGRDIMAPVAGYLSKGIPFSKFGPILKKITTIKLPRPILKNNKIYGELIHIDKFGNLITNMERENLAGKAFKSLIISNKKIDKISNSYDENPKGKLLAIWGSKGFLEISVNQGSAQKLLNAKVGDQIQVDII